MSRPIGMAIIGAGAVAAHHAAAALQTPLMSLTGVASRTRVRAEAFARRFGCRVFSSLDELVRDPAVELAVVCTLPDTHGALAIQAARAGKHVLVEKPLDVSLEGAALTVETCRCAGVVLATVSQKRFTDAMGFVRNAVLTGQLGRILQADAYVKWRRDEDYYARPGKGAWSVEGGGAVITQGIHQVDLLRWIAGPVERIRCEWQLGGLHAIESEDNAMALLRYQNGAMGVFQASTSLFPGFPDRLEIHGTLGSVITEGDRLLRWEVRDCPPPPPELFTPSGVGAAKPMDIPVEPFRRQLENVATAIRTGQPPFISGDEGFETLRLVMAMYQSAREGRDVFLC